MAEIFSYPHTFGIEQNQCRLITRVGKIVTPQTIPDVFKEDPDDNGILACALAGNANLIVSRDLDLLRLKRRRNSVSKRDNGEEPLSVFHRTLRVVQSSCTKLLMI